MPRVLGRVVGRDDGRVIGASRIETRGVGGVAHEAMVSATLPNLPGWAK